MSEPLVSIIVITYNSSKFIIETLESIKAQDYDNIELIISDDCSKDETLDLCLTWISKNRDRFLNCLLIPGETNKGIPANCNKGVLNSKGDWIKIIAGDDALMFDYVSIFIKYTIKHTTARVLHCDMNSYLDTFIDSKLIEIQRVRSLKINSKEITPQSQFEIMIRMNRILAPTIMTHKSVFDVVGPYDETLRLWEDSPMLIKIVKNNIRLHFVDYVGVKYRVHSLSVQKIGLKIGLISDLVLEARKYYLKNYLKYLPWYERMARWLTYKQELWFHKKIKEGNYKILENIFCMTSYPSKLATRVFNKRYI